MRSIVVASVFAVLAAIPARGLASAPASERAALAAAAAAIQRADYRGDRAELRRQVEGMPAAPAGGLGKYWLYWQGFAHWRRALNGQNETPTPPDLLADLDLAVAAFRAALAVDPSFEDARSGLMGCLGNQVFLLSVERPERADIIEEMNRIGAEIREGRGTMEENPRSLWLAGGTQLFAPPPHGGDAAKAEAIYLRGLQAAHREALAAAGRDPWIPAWGAPELLMSLAYLHAQGPALDRDVALAYAHGALAMVPDWRYVADMLLPIIEGLPLVTAGVQPAIPHQCAEGANMVKKLTPVLIVDAVEPVLPLWTGLGFARTAEVPAGDRLGFVILAHDGAELMVQSRASVRQDEPRILDGVSASASCALFVEVESLSEAFAKLPPGLDVIVERRTTPYGATEAIVRDAAGNVIILAQFERRNVMIAAGGTLASFSSGLIVSLLAAAPAAGEAAMAIEAPSFVNEGVLEAPIAEVWKTWPTAEGWKTLGGARADVEMRSGGLIRSHYRADGALGDAGSIQNRILAFEPPRMLAIAIDRPASTFPFKEAWKHSWTVITLSGLGDARTNLRIATLGYGADEESQAMRRFFEEGNAWTIKTLQEHFAPKGEARGADGREADRAAIRRHIESIFQAYLDVDAAKVRATHVPDWIGFTQDARSILRGLEAYMSSVWIGRVKGPEDVPADAPVMVSYRIVEMDFAFYGDVALVPYVAHVEVGRAMRLPAKLRSLDVYAKRGGEWIQIGSNLYLHPDTVEALRRQPRGLFGPERVALDAAREVVWRAFFAGDRQALEQALPDEAIVVTDAAERLLKKPDVLQAAGGFADAGAKLTRLEFPLTETQVYGDTAILYTTYSLDLENGGGERRSESGRGMEVFVQRDGGWVNAGWFLMPDPPK